MDALPTGDPLANVDHSAFWRETNATLSDILRAARNDSGGFVFTRSLVEVIECDENLICGDCGKVVTQHKIHAANTYVLCDGALADVQWRK